MMSDEIKKERTMQERFHHLTMRLATDDHTLINPSCLHSVFISRAFKLNYARVVAPLEPHIARNESLGHLWQDIFPVNGQFSFEVGCEMPYYLPNREKQAEYVLSVNTHHYRGV
jgi:hypothetical protein